MKRESFEDVLVQPFFEHHKKLRAFEEQLYGHILTAIDFEAVARFEFLVEQHLLDMNLPQDLVFDLTTQVIERALHRAAEAPERRASCGPPEGISPEEADAVAYDPKCIFCRAEREHAKALAKQPQHDHGGEPCAICDDLADDWREQHREVLEKAGLYKPPAPDTKERARLAWQPWPPKLTKPPNAS
jgi:hypothetical protein